MSRGQTVVNYTNGRQRVMHDLNLHCETNDLRQFVIEQEGEVLFGNFEAKQIDNYRQRNAADLHFPTCVGNHGDAREAVERDGVKHKYS